MFLLLPLLLLLLLRLLLLLGILLFLPVLASAPASAPDPTTKTTPAIAPWLTAVPAQGSGALNSLIIELITHLSAAPLLSPLSNLFSPTDLFTPPPLAANFLKRQPCRVIFCCYFCAI
jgi:hypothetical protein